jgi:hypothetical protein
MTNATGNASTAKPALPYRLRGFPERRGSGEVLFHWNGSYSATSAGDLLDLVAA